MSIRHTYHNETPSTPRRLHLERFYGSDEPGDDRVELTVENGLSGTSIGVAMTAAELWQLLESAGLR